ncbi:MAG: hypothetical protein KJO55_04990 [Gammaproteobacteria bacterium]|nr:hypothetical protein [Gammaproteobacteria bacterium]
MNWMRDNAFIVAAIVLPLLLALFFAAATVLPTLWVEDPRYDVYFALADHRSRGPLGSLYTVEDRRIVADAYLYPQPNHTFGERLFRFDAKSFEVEEITVDIPAAQRDYLLSRRDELQYWRENPAAPRPLPPNPPPFPSIRFAPAEFATLRLHPGEYAPDEYRIEFRHSNSGLLGEIFGGRHDRQLVIERDGRTIAVRVPAFTRNYYWASDLKVLGWVASDE